MEVKDTMIGKIDLKGLGRPKKYGKISIRRK